MLEFGDLVLARYWKWKHDPVPMIFVLLSDGLYVEGLNSHYLNKYEITYLRQILQVVPNNDANRVYYYLKNVNPSINRAYRKYFANLLVPLSKWKVKGLPSKDVKKDIDQFFKRQSDYTQLLTYDYEADRAWELLQQSETREAKNAAQRRRYWLNKASGATNLRDARLFQRIAQERGNPNPEKLGSILTKLQAADRANLGTLQDIDYFGGK